MSDHNITRFPWYKRMVVEFKEPLGGILFHAPFAIGLVLSVLALTVLFLVAFITGAIEITVLVSETYGYSSGLIGEPMTVFIAGLLSIGFVWLTYKSLKKPGEGWFSTLMEWWAVMIGVTVLVGIMFALGDHTQAWPKDSDGRGVINADGADFFVMMGVMGVFISWISHSARTIILRFKKKTSS